MIYLSLFVQLYFFWQNILAPNTDLSMMERGKDCVCAVAQTYNKRTHLGVCKGTYIHKIALIHSLASVQTQEKTFCL